MEALRSFGGGIRELDVRAPGERLLAFEFFAPRRLLFHHARQHSCDAEDFRIGFTDAPTHLFDFQFASCCLCECHTILILMFEMFP